MKANMDKEGIKKNVKNGSKSVHTNIPDEVLSSLVETVVYSNPKNPVSFAYVVGRNWAIDKYRHSIASARRKVKRAIEKREEDILYKAREQFEEIAGVLEAEIPKRRIKEMMAVIHSRLYAISPALTSKIHNVSVNVENQWFLRGKKEIKDYMPKELREVLKKWSKTKLKKVSARIEKLSVSLMRLASFPVVVDTHV